MELSKGASFAIIGVVALIIAAGAYFLFVGGDPAKRMSAGAQKNMEMYKAGKMPDATVNASDSRRDSPMSQMQRR